MRLRFFGRLRDAIGTGEVDVDVPRDVTDSDVFRTWVGSVYPALLDPSVRLALDDEMVVTKRQPLGAAREAAFLPPVSGG